MRHAQVSYFIVLALVLIILFGLLLFVKNLFFKTPNTNSFPPTIEPVKEHVEQCLFKTTVNGLRLLGLQGGVIYESQGGTVPDSFKNRSSYTTLYNGYYIWNSILAGAVSFNISCAPQDLHTSLYKYERCPSITFPFYDENSQRIVFWDNNTGLFAHDINNRLTSNLRLLNRLGLPGLYENEEPATMVDWIRPLLEARMKVRFDLARYIENNIKECLNFSELEKKDLKVTIIGEPVAKPLFSENATSIELQFPLKVVYNRTGNPTYIDKFSTQTLVRFGKIYKYVNDILKKEAKDYSYNLSTAQPEDGIILEQIYKDINPKKVDIVVFNDSKSILPDENGMLVNYRFYGAIPNSPPSISYIHYRNMSAVLGLADYLVSHCSFNGLFNTPLIQDVLSVRVFKKISREQVECIFNAYRNLLRNSRYRPAYDPDDDELGWSFRASNCSWNQTCEFDNEAEFSNMKSFIQIRFYELDNGAYDDILTIPVVLYNYAPEKPELRCLGKKDGWYVYEFSIVNQESGYGKDDLNLQVDVLTGSLRWELPGPPDDSRPPIVYWKIYFENKTGSYDVKFTVTDSFGESNSTVKRVNIPC